MRRFRIGNQIFDEGTSTIEQALSEAFARKERPLCLCREPGLEMYVARAGDRHVVKRMPNTGGQHDPSCDSYEPPYELSGLGQVVGSAIQEDVEQGVTALKLDFSLSKAAKRAAPVPGDGEHDSVRTDGAKLSLRALLHYLWDQAQFNHWTAAMQGRRNWGVVRWHLMEGAANKIAKGRALSEVLFIPEPFSVEKKTEIDRHRAAAMGAIQAHRAGARKLLLLIGEVKEFAAGRNGHRMIVRHLPDFPFLMNEDVYRRMQARFENELTLWDAVENTHLIAIATFGVGPTGAAAIEELALMVVTESWIPFETIFDVQLLNALAPLRERSIKGLRYNLPATEPLATVFLPRAQPAPLAMYIVPPGADADYRRALDDLIKESELAAWVWAAGETDMPPIPLSLARISSVATPQQS